MSEQLIDIKPIIITGDYSFFIFIVTILLALFIGYKLFKKFYTIGKKSCKQDCYRYYLEMFSSIDWSNPKEAAYLATKYGEVLAVDRRRKELFGQLQSHLDRYKYKRSVSKVDAQTLSYYNLYKQVCDESL